MDPQVTTDRAVVLGGSMAGLTAARVLADRYEEVFVVDRDDLTASDGHRRGVPQGRHIHTLLARGQGALEELFPGLTAELLDEGAPYFDVLDGARLYMSGHPQPRAPSGVSISPMSRPFLEGHVRARVRALPNVTFAGRHDALGLASTAEADGVNGVRISPRGGDGEEVLPADLVVDATGRGSRLPRWLEDLGYEPPEEEKVVIKVGYATARFELPADALDGDQGSLQVPTPDLPRGAAFWRLESGLWMLTLFGVAGDYPPTDPEGFFEFTRSLRFSDPHDAIGRAEPVEAPLQYRFPANTRRRYERLGRFPDGLAVLGDSVCSFNPIYGQGMTVAALQALALRDHLERNSVPRSRRLLRELARIIDDPWELAIGGDLAFPTAEGRRSIGVRTGGSYMSHLLAAAARDPTLATAFARVAGLVDPPRELMRPRLAIRVLRGLLRRSRSSTTP